MTPRTPRHQLSTHALHPPTGSGRGALLAASLCVALAACSGDPPASVTDTSGPDATDTSEPTDTHTGLSPEQEAILAVAETERWVLPGLSDEVHVVRTEGNIPHVYASNLNDLGRALGFVQARDRFFFMDLQRRLGLGTLTELLGELGLERDVESRGTGMTYVTDRLVDHLSDELRAYLEAFADGVNAYIEAVRREEVAPPSETQFAGLLGADEPADMMSPFGLRDVVALVTVFMYSTNFETGDVGAQAALERLDGLFAGFPKEELRRAGYLGDVWSDIQGIFPQTSSTEGFGLTGAGTGNRVTSGAARSSEAPGETPGQAKAAAPRPPPAALPLPPGMADRLHARLEARFLALGRDRDAGFGSNVWAVAGTHTTDGASILANDGHLELSVPSLGYGAALDTRVFGGGDIHQMGGWLGNFPVMVGGTNGDVAWGGVNPVLDITDWYREELELDGEGRPVASRFAGEWRPLIAVDEAYEIADVPVLSSEGRTETWTRWTTFDGRWITSIEGRRVASPDEAEEGETVVNLLGDLIIPGDIDGDGIVTGISFDYAAFDATRFPDALFELGRAADVDEVREATRGFVGAALFTGASDRHGNILFTSYQAVPCRDHLDREGDAFAPGADPTLLLDGTRYGGFELPTDAAGKADEGPGATDPARCIVPFDEMPHAINPEPGFVFNANNDPGRITDDGDERTGPWYIGGPWSTVRANTIRRELTRITADRSADVDAMIALQANVTSRMGEELVPPLLAAIDLARALSAHDGPREPHEDRMVATFDAHRETFEAVEARLAAWGERGFEAASGVETFYHAPTADDAADAVATMIFNAWFPRFVSQVWDDEQITAWRWNSTRSRVAKLLRFLAGRGPDNPEGLASWDPDTGESVFFDRVGTPEVERSDELMLVALADALAFLSGPTTGPGEGGFDTEDQSAWLWGLRHVVRFESILAGFVGNAGPLGLIFDMFAISTQRIPLLASLPAGDPRRALRWFPRPGDQWSVDAANPGTSGTRFSYGSGPAMRLVFRLKDGEVDGGFILPGGQSGVLESPHFDDQVRLWLGNAYYPVRFHPQDVADGAIAREVYAPAP